MRKIMMNDLGEKPLKEVFETFVINGRAKGLAEATVKKYYEHLYSAVKHFEVEQPISNVPIHGIFECFLPLLYSSIK